MKVNIYKNYGCLTSEKKPVFTYGAEEATAVCSDIVTVDIPDGYIKGHTATGEPIIKTPEMEFDYLLSELIGSKADGSPALVWFDGRNTRKLQLKEI